MMTAFMPQTYGYPLDELLTGFVSDDTVIDSDCEVTGLSINSREVHQGDLFIACRGEQHHALKFAVDAINRGAVAIVYETPLDNIEDLAGLAVYAIPVIAVSGLSNKVGFIADRFYARPSQSMRVVGVTGTNGKTSCSHFLAQVLANDDNPVALLGTLGNGMYGKLQPSTHTTPDAVFVQQFLARMLEQNVVDAVMEVSSHGIEQGRVNGVTFSTAVFTNLSREHLDYHGDMESYGRSKARLFQMPGLRYAVINADDEFGCSLLESLQDTVQSVAYSLSDAMNADAAVLRNNVMHLGCVQGSDLQFTDDGLSMHISSPWGDTELRSHLYGRFNAENILAVLATALINGMRIGDAVERIELLTNVAGRMQHVEGSADQPLVMVDYAHTPDALQHALQAMRMHGQGHLWCVFGCGGDRDTGKRPLMGAVADEHADEIVLTDDNPRTEDSTAILSQIQAGIKRQKNLHVESDRERAIAYALAHAGADDVVLIAGKGHEEYQLVGDRRLPFSDINVARQILTGAQQ